jgi:putative NADH-flavin reductase
MRLVVVAASGRVGRQVVALAVERGTEPLALARTPDRVPAPAVAHALDLRATTPSALAAVLRPDDVVVSCLGAARRRDVGIAAAGTSLVLAAMREAGVAPLVTISASPVAGLLPGGQDLGEDLVTRRLLNPVVRRVLRDAYADLAAMETLLRRSSAAWTVVRPPRLTDGPRTGHYRTAVDRALPRARTVSRADLAHLLLRLAGDPRATRQAVSVAY